MTSRVLTSSLWAQSMQRRYAALTEDRTVDVVVVGAGLAGLLTATALRREGRDVLVLERDLVGGVATRNTTAKVSALQGTVLSKIVDARDNDAAVAYASAQVDAVTGLRSLIESEGIDCALTPADNYTYAEQGDAVRRVADELEAARRAGLAVESSGDIGMPFDVAAAVVLRNQFHINPAELCTGLAERLGDGHVAEGTSVLDIDENDHGATVTTASGGTVHAQHAVVATQSPIVDPMLLANRCVPMQSYAIAVRLDHDVPDTMCLSADDFTISLRPAAMDDERVLIVGGNGHRMGEPATTDRWDALEVWAEKYFGSVEVLHRWATHDLVTTDHVPFIGRLRPSSHRRWVATGFGKWGMTNSYVAATIIRDAIVEAEPKPWASVFDSTRVLSTLATRDVATVGASAMHHLIGDRIARRPEPRCTHQGCVLRKDEALNTWDCPCHGSRFDSEGGVLQGPANEALKSQ